MKVGVNIYREIRTIESKIREFESSIEFLIDSIDGNTNEVINLLEGKLRELKNTQSELLNAKYVKIIKLGDS